jgi:hypothetical protein
LQLTADLRQQQRIRGGDQAKVGDSVAGGVETGGVDVDCWYGTQSGLKEGCNDTLEELVQTVAAVTMNDKAEIWRIPVDVCFANN